MKALSKKDKPVYFHSVKELGIKGKRSARSRLRGINTLKKHCLNKTVLDVGCAEGVVAYALAQYGCRLVHGIDRRHSSLERARELFEIGNRKGRIHCEFDFFTRDFSDPDAIFNGPSLGLRASYDIVLLLGVYHDANLEEAERVLRCIAPRCGEFLLFRGGIVLLPGAADLVTSHGFEKYRSVRASLSHGLFQPDRGRPSPLEIYRKRMEAGPGIEQPHGMANSESNRGLVTPPVTP